MWAWITLGGLAIGGLMMPFVAQGVTRLASAIEHRGHKAAK